LGISQRRPEELERRRWRRPTWATSSAASRSATAGAIVDLEVEISRAICSLVSAIDLRPE
jgi:hypothetical protein